MPQLFQVIKCFKCSVFQVHQTKKSPKWECKLCGEKQSMKRHYGLGTGKECRLHVQKLNGIRGELDEFIETTELNKDSDEEASVKTALDVPNKPESTNSKWSEFVETEDHKEPEYNESMYLGNTEVVLEVPAKRRKFSKPKSKSQTATLHAHSSATDADIIYNVSEPSSSDRIVFPMPPDPENLNGAPEKRFIKITDQSTKCDINESIQLKSKTSFVPPKIDKNSKWAQFADYTDEENIDTADLNTLCNEEDNKNFSSQTSKNYTDDSGANIVENLQSFKDEEQDNSYNASNLFSLCDENDLDDILDMKF